MRTRTRAESSVFRVVFSVTSILVLLFVAYLGSYPLMYRVVSNSEPLPDLPDGHRWAMYGPVDWMIDKTPLRRPILWWCSAVGVDEAFENASDVRTGARSSQEVYGDMLDEKFLKELD